MWFTRMLKVLGIKRPALSLHSLRHTLIGKSVEERTYMAGLQFSVKDLSEALEAVKFPVLLTADRLIYGTLRRAI